RLNEVERYLRETDIPLADIAEKVGFSSQSHMTTALKKNRSVTPGEIRRGRVISNG
ncbi:helix-turn-helix transcriptional regulator, partial [Paraburkholderia aspalathi]|nr:helix-turn-helix transcriptional regulator [Paraburkholderia aspalathi]